MRSVPTTAMTRVPASAHPGRIGRAMIHGRKPVRFGVSNHPEGVGRVRAIGVQIQIESWSGLDFPITVIASPPRIG